VNISQPKLRGEKLDDMMMMMIIIIITIICVPSRGIRSEEEGNLRLVFFTCVFLI